MKNTNIVVIILIVLAVIVGVYVYMTMYSARDISLYPRNNMMASTTPTGSTATATIRQQSNSYLSRDGVYVVQYTNAGFVPKQLQIPQGKSVRFINMSDRGLRVFADTGTDPKFTELNEAKTISKGATYTFSFVNSGLWAYHNEVQPSDSANIAVY